MSKHDLCWEIDRIKYSWAVVGMECDSYEYWRHYLYTIVMKYCPERMNEFANLY